MFGLLFIKKIRQGVLKIAKSGHTGLIFIVSHSSHLFLNSSDGFVGCGVARAVAGHIDDDVVNGHQAALVLAERGHDGDPHAEVGFVTENKSILE